MVVKRLRLYYGVGTIGGHPRGTRRCWDVESTSMPLIQRRINVVYPVGSHLYDGEVFSSFSHSMTDCETQEPAQAFDSPCTSQTLDV